MCTQEDPDKHKIRQLNIIIAFITKIHTAVPIVCQFLASKNSSETQDAIQFFVTIHNFGVQQAQVCFYKKL